MINQKGQGSLEYLLIIAGAVLVAAIAVGLIVTTSSQTGPIGQTAQNILLCEGKSTYSDCMASSTICTPVSSNGATAGPTNFDHCAANSTPGGSSPPASPGGGDQTLPVIGPFILYQDYGDMLGPSYVPGSQLPEGSYLAAFSASDASGFSSWSLVKTNDNTLICSGSTTISSGSCSFSISAEVDGGGSTVPFLVTISDGSPAQNTTTQTFTYMGPDAACPRVDAFIDGEWVEVGRAIRFNEGVNQIGQWDIVLENPASKFRIVEDEPEVSYIHWIKGDGLDWGLGSIATRPASYLGATDGSVHEFTFSTPVSKLETYGYYEKVEK